MNKNNDMKNMNNNIIIMNNDMNMNNGMNMINMNNMNNGLENIPGLNITNNVVTINNNNVNVNYSNYDFSVNITNNVVNINKSINISINKKNEYINNIIKEANNIMQSTIFNKKKWDEERARLKKEEEEENNGFWEEQNKKKKEFEEKREREKKEWEEMQQRLIQEHQEKKRKKREEQERKLREWEEEEERIEKEWEEEQKRVERELEEQQERETKEWGTMQQESIQQNEEKKRKERELEEQIDKQNKEWMEKEQKKWEEQQRKRKEEEERRRKEEEERRRKEEEEYQKELERQRKEWEEKERIRKEEEERQRKIWEEQERKRKEEEERKRKEEEDIIKNPKRGRIDILATLDKEKLKKIVKSCPKRTSLSLNNFREYFKKATTNLTEEEKAYALFFWMHDNIAYDVEGLRTGNLLVEPEESYTRGMTVCSGYSRLYKYIGKYIGIDVICVMGYAKGAGYSVEDLLDESNHEWNILRFKKVYYQMDSTWGAGHLNGNKFVKELNEFYFCPIPERLIATHHPDEDKWQLLYPFVSLEEFGRIVNYGTNFYKYFTTDIKYHTFKVKSKHTIRFNKVNEKDNLGVIVKVYDKNGRETKNALCMPLYNKNYIEFFYIFKGKGIYKTDIFASPKAQKSRAHIVTYYLECTEDFKQTASTPFSLPKIYENDVTIIEPLFNNLKKGKQVTLKFRCDDADEIIITNGEWLTVKKNQDGIFEKTITVKTDEVYVGKKNGNSFETSITYKVN